MRSKSPLRASPAASLCIERLEDRTLLAGDVIFAEPVVYEAGGAPGSVIAGDIDGDELLDLIVGNGALRGGGRVAVLLGHRDGTFARARSFAAGSPYLGTADLDGDGDLDLSVADPQARRVSVLLNKGSTGERWGGFSRPSSVIEVGGRPQDVTSGDFDRDGHIDVATGTPVMVLLNDGLTGEQWNGLAEWETYSPGNHSSYITSGDVDQDGDLDLVVGNYFGGDVSVLLGNGDGTFDHVDNFPVGDRAGSVVLGDFNGDGHLDIASPVFDSNKVSVLLGNGDGTFADGIHYLVQDRTWSLTAADLDNDGDLDLAASSFSRSIFLLINNGDGTFFEQEGSLSAAVGTASGITTADLDGDGDLDLVTAGTASGSGVNVFLNHSGQDRDTVWDGSEQIGNVGDGVTWSDPNNWTVEGVTDRVPAADFPGDNVVFAGRLADVRVDLGQERTVNSVTFQTDVTLVGNTFTVTSGKLTVAPEIIVTINSNIVGKEAVRKKGEGTLIVGGSTDDVVVEAGTLRGDGTITELTANHGATLAPGVDVGAITIGRDARIEGTLLIELDGTKNDELNVGNNVFLLDGSALQLRAINPLGTSGETIRTVVNGRRGGKFTSEPTIGEHVGSGAFVKEVTGTGSAVIYTNRSVMVSLFQAAAGDVNGDGQFDQQDIIELLQAEKYLTGSTADWREGDWDGNGLFDQLDIVAALRTGNYLNGQYAVLSGH